MPILLVLVLLLAPASSRLVAPASSSLSTGACSPSLNLMPVGVWPIGQPGALLAIDYWLIHNSCCHKSPTTTTTSHTTPHHTTTTTTPLLDNSFYQKRILLSQDFLKASHTTPWRFISFHQPAPQCLPNLWSKSPSLVIIFLESSKLQRGKYLENASFYPVWVRILSPSSYSKLNIAM